MSAEVMTIIAALAGTVSLLAGAYAAVLRSRITQLEGENGRCEKKYNRLASLIITVTGNTESVQEMREELARVLEGD